jgi:hypothetical protein
MPTELLSHASRTTAGVLLLAIVTIEYGGVHVLRIVRGHQPATAFQETFARAGHAHAGVLVTLALVGQVLVDATSLSGLAETLAREAIPAAAILVPAGFFLSSAGRDRTEPNRFILALHAGVASLAVGVVALGLGLLTA